MILIRFLYSNADIHGHEQKHFGFRQMINKMHKIDNNIFVCNGECKSDFQRLDAQMLTTYELDMI